MIFRRWTSYEFKEAGFVAMHPSQAAKFERVGLPIYAKTSDPHGEVYLPRWGKKLYDDARSYVSDEQMSRLCAAAIRSDDPDAFVESVLAAYALGGWRAALQVAEAQEDGHAEGPA